MKFPALFPGTIRPTSTALRRPLARFFRACLLTLSVSTASADDRIDLPVRVNGQLMRFAFDTGAGGTAFVWQDVAQMLALKSAPQTQGPLDPGRVAFELSEPVELEVLGNKLPDVRLTVIDAPPYAKWEMQGLIGWPALRNNVLRLDLGRDGVTPLASMPEEAKTWTRLRVVDDRDVLMLEVPLKDGTAGLLSIDTGDGTGVSLAPRLWAEWKTANPETPRAIVAAFMLATGVSASEIAAAREWTLGPIALTNVLIQEAHPSHVALGGDNYLATFGCDALRKLTLIVDAKNGWAYLKPRNDSPDLGNYNRLGAVFLPAGEKPEAGFVARVMPGSPAATAGLRDGDRLVKLNGVAVDHWRQRPGTWPLASFFEQPPGVRHELLVRRGDQTVSLQPVLQNVLALQNHPPHPARPPEPPLGFHFLPPIDSLARQGTASGIPLGTVKLAPEPGPMRKGDSVTALITCVDADKLQQWLVLFAANDPKPEELKAGRKQPTLFTPSGYEIRFDPTPAAVAIHVVGPVEKNGGNGKVRDEWSGALVTREFLALGLHSTALAIQKLGRLRHGGLGFDTKAFPAKEAAVVRAELEAANIVEADERAFAGGVMAIADFFRIAAQTPGVRDALRQMIDISWKDFLKSPQINIQILRPVEDLSPALWGLPRGTACRAFRVRVDLNGVPRLVCRVVATEPRRPLQTTAGVVGIVASRPDGSGPHVMVRVLSARLAENAPAK